MAADNQPTQKGGDPELVVGEFTIKRSTERSVFIRKGNGEGCEFPLPLFEIAVRIFYKENS